VKYSVAVGNAVTVETDLLVLKYAQHRYGVDRVVSDMLLRSGQCAEADISPPPTSHALVATGGVIAAPRVLFVGTLPIDDLTYRKISEIATRSLKIIDQEQANVRHLATTVHGPGFGLDPGIALQAMKEGFQRGHRAGYGAAVETVTFVEIGERRARTLTAALDLTLETTPTLDDDQKWQAEKTATTLGSHPRSTPRDFDAQRHVFVAMPYATEYEDVWELGIYPAVSQFGFVCEHVGNSVFTGDVFERIRGRIKSAELMIADLTGARPNVYLEVGYALGCGVPVVIVAHEGEKLHFDISTHKCLYYRNITHLKRELEKVMQSWSPAS